MRKRPLTLANNPLLSGPALVERGQGAVPYREIRLDAIEVDPNQPRALFDEEKLNELADSIKTYGVLNPVLVRNGERGGTFQLIAGERRLRAARLAKLETIPAIIDTSEAQDEARTLAMQLVENLQRAELSPLERAQAIGLLKEQYNLSIRDIGAKLGISKSMVQRSLELLDLPDDLLNALKEGASESKILLLAKIEDEEIRAGYLKDLDVLTRSQIQKDVKQEVKTTAISERTIISAEDSRIADELQRSLGLKVRLQRSNPEEGKGKLTIEFYSEEDLQDVFRRLVGE
jgi:ParB family transcriptional regulator, chromosome partitioning protein